MKKLIQKFFEKQLHCEKNTYYFTSGHNLKDCPKRCCFVLFFLLPFNIINKEKIYFAFSPNFLCILLCIIHLKSVTFKQNGDK